MLVVSYNPNYQSVLKDLKPSTRQRMVSVDIGFLPPEIEIEVLLRESGIDETTAHKLVKLANAIRELDLPAIPEVSSTRTLIAAADLAKTGVDLREAIHSGLVGPLCDDRSVASSLMELAEEYLK